MTSTKKTPIKSKRVVIDMNRGSTRGRLACGFFKHETTARAKNAVRIHPHCICYEIWSEVLFELASLQMLQKSINDKGEKVC